MQNTRSHRRSRISQGRNQQYNPKSKGRGVRWADAHRDMTNRKPFRSKGLKDAARAEAFIGDDGAWHSPVKVMIHTKAVRHAS